MIEVITNLTIIAGVSVLVGAGFAVGAMAMATLAGKVEK